MPRHLIAIDASGLSPQPSGPDRYTLSLIRALSRVDAEHDYVVYACDFSLPELAGLGEHFRLVEAGPWAPGGRRVWQQAGLALDLMRRRASLLHSPNQTTPRLVPSKRIVTIYDLGPFILPEEHDAASRQAIQASVKRADAVLVPSQSVADRLIEETGVDPSHVTVTHPGVDPSFRAMDPEHCAALAMDSYGLRPGYILSLGPGHPQKNRGAIFLTLRRLLDDGFNVHVAVIGDDGSPAQQAMVTDFGLENHVSFCGFVPQQDLPALYNAASILLHPAMHDGLGLSVLEAMACSAPLVVTDRSSPPELAGEACITVDPFDIDGMVAAVAHILDDPSLATRMRFDGLKRAADFSWEACAERTVEVYKAVLGESV